MAETRGRELTRATSGGTSKRHECVVTAQDWFVRLGVQERIGMEVAVAAPLKAEAVELRFG